MKFRFVQDNRETFRVGRHVQSPRGLPQRLLRLAAKAARAIVSKPTRPWWSVSGRSSNRAAASTARLECTRRCEMRARRDATASHGSCAWKACAAEPTSASASSPPSDQELPAAPNLLDRRFERAGRRHHAGPHSRGMAPPCRRPRSLLSARRRLGHRTASGSADLDRGSADRHRHPPPGAGSRPSLRSRRPVRRVPTTRIFLDRHGMVCSMSRPGNCLDNAVVESFFHTLKTEWLYHYRFTARAQARLSIFDYIEGFYNRTRLHSTLGYRSPMDYEIVTSAA